MLVFRWLILAALTSLDGKGLGGFFFGGMTVSVHVNRCVYQFYGQAERVKGL